MLEKMEQKDTEHKELIQQCLDNELDVQDFTTEYEQSVKSYNDSLEAVELYKSALESQQGVIAQYDNAITELQNTQVVAAEVSDVKRDFDASSGDSPKVATGDSNDTPVSDKETHASKSDNKPEVGNDDDMQTFTYKDKDGNEFHNKYSKQTIKYLEDRGYIVKNLVAQGKDLDMMVKDLKESDTMAVANGASVHPDASAYANNDPDRIQYHNATHISQTYSQKMQIILLKKAII